MVRESDIVYENPFAWVLRESNAYVVMRPGVTHSTSDSAYARDADGLSIATARAVYFLKAKVNEILKTRWTDEHRVEAIREGWDLWTSFGSENGPLQVQRFDDVEEAQFALEDLCAKLGAPGRPLPCSVIPEFTRDDGVMSILAKQPIEPGVEFNILMLGALLDDNRYIEPDTHRAQMKDPVPDEAESAHASAPS